MHANRRLLGALSIFVILTTILSSVQIPAASAQGRDGIQRDYNAESGKVTRITGTGNEPIVLMGAMSSDMTSVERSDALVERFAPEFGLVRPSEELIVAEESQPEPDRVVTKYQQVYEGVPVMGGELIVNASARGALYSMNGEVAQGLSLDTDPAISVETAIDIAKQGMVKWYGGSKQDYQHSDASLQIFDESLLRPSPRPAELVWKMEMKPVNVGQPIRELVLVSAKTGNIPLHFNQVDTAWNNQVPVVLQQENNGNSPKSQGNWPLYFEIALDETRGWIYGSDSGGNKIDVISTTTLQLVKSFTLTNGASPRGIALSPDGTELAIAQSGAGSLLFLNPDTGSVIATTVPDVSIGPNKPWDVLYGRAERLYSTGNPDSSGFEYIHIINTATHLEISKSSHIVRSAPRLSISPDKNILYANDANSSPQKIYKYDVSTDTIPDPISTPHTSELSAIMHTVDPASGYIFTDTGQIWAPDLTVKIGSTGITGEVTSIPSRNAIAVAAPNSDKIVFVDSSTFYTLSTYTLSGPMGALIAKSDGNKLFVSTSDGIAAIDLTSFPPGIPGTLPVGLLPYSDIVLDEPHGVLFGSNTTGHKIDVISLSNLELVDEIRLTNGASPKGMDLSPDGNELAVALNGANRIDFIDTDTREVTASVFPEESNSPFDVKYGRPGRLYSTGNPNSSGFEYIHIIDTTTHTHIGKSGYIIRAEPFLAMSADNNYLLVNEQFLPNKLFRFNVSSDTIGNPTSTPHVSGFTADTYIVLEDESKIFTDTGQVWSNPLDLNLSTQIGTFNASGYLVEIPSVDLAAVLGGSGSIHFVRTTDYSIAAEFTIPAVSTFGPGAINSNESKMFLTTNNGIAVLNLDPESPAVILVESGSNQAIKPGNQFSQPLKAKLQNYLGQPIAGVTVTFTAPASGTSGIFAGTNSNTATGVTDANGVATAPAFTANTLLGAYVVQATASGLLGSAEFNLSNGTLIRTYTANNSSSLPGTLLCTEATTNCTDGDNLQADRAHQYAFGTYDLFTVQHGRNSIDNAGMTITSTVDYCDPDFSCPYGNANWNGSQMVYGSAFGFANADDVVAHELTHGVTEFESNLFYFYQSGAINESFSDLWGEFYDQTNGAGTDNANTKWLLGEDVTGMGAFRSMKNPPQFGDPDKMTSSLYNKKPFFDVNWDNGGVHSNSGVNNKAVYLMVDGGTFNGKTVAALGWEKVGALYYEVNTNLLTSGSDYSDLYYALQQACINLLGENNITSADCLEVKDAVDAVQMNSQPVSNFNPDAPLCPTGMTTNPSQTLFKDGFESDTAQWLLVNGWDRESFYAAGGQHMMWGDDENVSSEGTLILLHSVELPVGSTPFLHFKHAFAFEHLGSKYWDGGVLEYALNNEDVWFDARPLFSAGQNYKGVMVKSATSSNILNGRAGFVGDSHGYVSSRYDLTSLAGNQVQFRWRFGTDQFFYYYGWFLDDVSIYNCVGTPTVPVLQVPANNALLKSYAPLLDWSNAKSVDHYELQVATDSTFTSLVHNELNLPTSQFQVPLNLDSNTKYYWRVRGVNGLGQPGKWTAARTFRTVLTPPALISPTSNFTSKELRPLFDWDAPSGPGTITGYTIQIAKDPLFKQIVHTGNPVTSQYVPTTNLPKNMTLHWRVLAKGANGPSAYSEVRSFTTPVNPPPAPVLVLPANSALLTNYANPTFKWKPITFVDASFKHYQVQMATDMAFSDLVLNDTSITTRATGQLITSLTLTPNTRYYWRMRAVNTTDELSNWSAVRTIRAAILPPTLLTPDDNSTGVARKPLLDWDDVVGNTGYVLQIWKAGTTPILVKTVTLTPNVSQYKFLTNLQPNTAYFWKVQTKAANGPSAWSQQFHFTTGP